MSERLTQQQMRALSAFGYPPYYDEISDSTVWMEGVRPWPTMDNLARKGLCRATSWLGGEDGWLYEITDEGKAWLEAWRRERP